ncbi:MAG: hypothetical protein UT34_C0002G0141 [candidate division WS6 bacterium GW2011_GWF2_39_15]|uniref:Uncharacterized protein n=1 Tax=candidate division WS6 bacterium GW2011_GWF2_39_15 TaxID=1619100 RepID=A0A0G0MNK8_9BACT|nr:MAG: hypothetical protein UT34_C0002G0141 [candidate division WS6 bacterium GW2011_GWF2_39_15]
MLSYETRTPFGDKPGVKMFVGSEFAEFAEVNGLQFPSSGTALGTNEYCYMIVGYDSQQNDLDTPYHKFLFPPLDKRFKEYVTNLIDQTGKGSNFPFLDTYTITDRLPAEKDSVLVTAGNILTPALMRGVSKLPIQFVKLNEDVKGGGQISHWNHALEQEVVNGNLFTRALGVSLGLLKRYGQINDASINAIVEYKQRAIEQSSDSFIPVNFNIPNNLLGGSTQDIKELMNTLSQRVDIPGDVRKLSGELASFMLRWDEVHQQAVRKAENDDSFEAIASVGISSGKIGGALDESLSLALREESSLIESIQSGAEANTIDRILKNLKDLDEFSGTEGVASLLARYNTSVVSDDKLEAALRLVTTREIHISNKEELEVAIKELSKTLKILAPDYIRLHPVLAKLLDSSEFTGELAKATNVVGNIRKKVLNKLKKIS